ncbi:MAG: asparagine synthetase B, partial [Oscillospiraceae bacterium]|nr:asparagine synthetase B [Oscillospiraceae bacterium]
MELKTYRGHIRNWEKLCRELGIDTSLSREEREKAILCRGYEKWGTSLPDHLYGMFAFAI